jgi:hypothetical protein
LGLRRWGFGNVYRAATDHRAASSVRHEFRKGHPNRHKLLLSVASSGGITIGNHCHRLTPVNPNGQREVKATMELTVFLRVRGAKIAES